MSIIKNTHSPDSDNGRVERVQRPAWRVQATARAPRTVALVLAGVLMVAGLRTIIAGPPEPPAAAKQVAASDQTADAFADGFVRAYLTWNPDRLDQRQRRLAAYTTAELNDGAGLEPGDTPQTVDDTTVIGSQPAGKRRRIVTVLARVDAREMHLAVPVTRDADGYLAVTSFPALVGPPPPASTERPPEEQEVEDPELVEVSKRAVRNYLAGAKDNLAADLDDDAVVSLPRTHARVRSVDEVTHTGPRKVAVVVEAALDKTHMSLRYELDVVRRDRWYVAAIEGDPRGEHAPKGSRR